MNPTIGNFSLCHCGKPKLSHWLRCNECDNKIRTDKKNKRELRKKLLSEKRQSIIEHYNKTKCCSKTARFFGISRMYVWKIMGKDKRCSKNKIPRKQILERDNYCCTVCKTTENLCVHHIDRDTFNNKYSNLRTLCRKCHEMIHLTGNEDLKW